MRKWSGPAGRGAADGALMPEVYGADCADRAGWTDGVWCVGMGGLGGPVNTRDFVEVGMGLLQDIDAVTVTVTRASIWR
jgi:hypothetical protein